MIIKTKQFKESCSSILSAIDNSELSTYTEALELVTVEDKLYLNVTNKEYYASAIFNLEEKAELHAVINASTFLKLVAAITTEEIELQAKDKYLLVKANGNYKFPLIYENGELMKLPRITINNPTLDMNIGGDILNSIVTYNSKVLSKQDSTPIQKLYYLDQEGCITFTSCACVNNFKLEKPVKLLFNNKLVRLFKLFKNDMVKFTLGYDKLGENLTQTKVRLETNSITLTSIIPGDTLLGTYPVVQLRNLANKVYPYIAVLNVEKMIEALNRLKLLNKNEDSCLFKCNQDEVIIKMGEDEETIPTANGSNIEEDYDMTLRLSFVKSVLDTIDDQYVTFNLGNHSSVAVVRGNVVNVIPECGE